MDPGHKSIKLKCQIFLWRSHFPKSSGFFSDVSQLTLNFPRSPKPSVKGSIGCSTDTSLLSCKMINGSRVNKDNFSQRVWGFLLGSYCFSSRFCSIFMRWGKTDFWSQPWHSLLSSAVGVCKGNSFWVMNASQYFPSEFVLRLEWQARRPVKSEGL